MKALVLGCGSIGFRHIGHLRQLGLSDLEVVDPDPDAREKVKVQYGIHAAQDPEVALNRRPDIVLICTPAATHLPLTLKALKAGAHVFVEKPLSISLEGVDALLEKVRLDGRIVQVGYQLRYHPAMRQTKRILSSGQLGKILSAHAEFGLYLKKWWPGRDYRESYMSKDEEGGGLLLDVSHEIDLILWFLGRIREVFAYGGKLSTLEIPGLDLIKVLMRTEADAVVSVFMDCLSPTYTRGYLLIGEGAALRWDCPEGRADGSLGRLQWCGPNQDRFEPLQVQGDPQQVYIEELKDFLSSVAQRKGPLVGVEHAAEVLKVVAAIQKSLQIRTKVEVV